ncbi:hypothetical protein DRQ23_04940 [bacterium]|nr:MAG: hypothetical protein DRQ23_04940 [bacterium]
MRFRRFTEFILNEKYAGSKKEEIMDKGKNLEDFYNIFPWDSEPESESGKAYYEFTGKMMELALPPEVLKGIKKKNLDILEVCAGAGFGGVALGEYLKKKGFRVKLLMTDLRGDALERARKFAKRKGLEVEVKVMDALQLKNLKQKFDVVLFWGLSTPHFNPHELLRLFSSFAHLLKRGGFFIMDEADRRGSIFLKTGYKFALGEERGGRFVMSFHTGYNPYTGMFRRRYVSPDGSNFVQEIYLWGIAEVSAMLSVFFKKVKLLDISAHYIIVSQNPFTGISPENIKEPVIERLK